MYSVILQPTGNSVAQFNYHSTIRTGVQLSEIKPYLKSKEFAILSDVYKNGRVHVWGVIPGSSNKREWDKVQRGDVSIFSGKGEIFASGTVTYKVHKPKLAEYLWGETAEGKTWEYLYFLDEIKNHSIDISVFNTLLGYSVNNPIRGFRVLDQEKSNIIMDAFDFYSSTYAPIVKKEEAKKDIKDIISDLEQNASLDREVRGRARKEQGVLRSYLFGDKKTCTCGICGEEFPVDLLVAAHIKKRAFCTTEEKLDIENIAIPMCKFGCDDLFEKGYIAVLDKKIVSLVDAKLLPSIVQRQMKNLEGKVCGYENEDSTKYFLWHYNHHKK